MTLNRLAILAVQQSNDKPQVRALLEEAWQHGSEQSDQRALAETEWNLAQITASCGRSQSAPCLMESMRSLWHAP